MKYEFLNRENTGRLIIIFAGWSTLPSFYRNISLPGWDLLVVYDYADLDFPQRILDGYVTIALFAWSLGVFAASRTLPFSRISLAVAINGTETPVNDSEGIPGRVFDTTASTLDDRNLMKFHRRVFGEDYESLRGTLTIPEGGTPELADQLHFIRRAANVVPERGDATPARWHRAYISRRDLIFPAANQQRSWENHPSRPERVVVDAPHYLDLEKIITSALPAKVKVGREFHKALSTYDEEATAQKTIASRLTDFPGRIQAPLKVMLEIGPGSGIFTKEYTRRFSPEKIDYIDLYPLPEFNAAPDERYFIGDAEEWLATEAEKHPGSYDAILSASAMQWFADPEAFFRNASRLLRPGGMLLCSTFLPGNLREMQEVNPYGLIYRTTEELESMMLRYFSFAKLEEEDLCIKFATPRDTLRHLSRTGVGGGISSRRTLSELLRSTPLSLTYRPLYIYGVTKSTTT